MRSWGEFKDRILERFRATQEGDLHEHFFALTHDSIGKSLSLSWRLGEISEAMLEDNFIKGLKPKIRAALCLLRPRGLGVTMELAQMIEDKNIAKWINKRKFNRFFISK